MEPTRRRLIGVDVGTKKVGLAKADPLRMFAQPIGTFEPSEALDMLVQIHRDEGIELVVVGWPLTEEGKEGPATAMVNVFVRRMRKRIPRLQVHRLDERYTTEEARSRLGGSVSRERVDTMAAGIILQEYLDQADG